MIGMSEFDGKAFSLAAGLMWSMAVLALGVGSMFIQSWQIAVEWLGNFYVGYTSTIAGSALGAVYGFIDVFVGLYAFFWLYNYFRENPVF